jgi:predicted nucleic acid-binding protein
VNKVLVDSSVLLDLFTNDPVWADRSQAAIARILESAALPCVNDMVYAEVSVGFRRIEDCDTALEDIGIVHEAIPKEALFLAGKAFLSYRHITEEPRPRSSRISSSAPTPPSAGIPSSRGIPPA